MKRTFKEDKINGDLNEHKFMQYMKNTQNINLTQSKDPFAEIDFKIKNKKHIIELKSRFIQYKEFDTTMIGYNKIQKARRLKRKNYQTDIYFLFTDGLYKWEVNEDEIICTMPAVRLNRGKTEIKEHSFIPIKYLKFITNEILSSNI